MTKQTDIPNNQYFINNFITPVLLYIDDKPVDDEINNRWITIKK